MSKSQAKNETPFPLYLFLTIFNSKKASCKQIYKFYRIMRIYSNVYNYAIYVKLLRR